MARCLTHNSGKITGTWIAVAATLSLLLPHAMVGAAESSSSSSPASRSRPWPNLVAGHPVAEQLTSRWFQELKNGNVPVPRTNSAHPVFICPLHDLPSDDWTKVVDHHTREAFRQALLITAMEEFHVPIRDLGLEHVSPRTEFRGDLVLPEIVVLAHSRDLRVILVFRRRETGPEVLFSRTVLTDSGNSSADLVELAAELSRNEFVQILKSCGLRPQKKLSATEHSTADEIQTSLNDLDLWDHYRAIQKLYGAETPGTASLAAERQALLARTYSQLGSLTQPAISHASTIYHSRGLIYSERALSLAPESPFVLAHRALSWALVGNHCEAAGSLWDAISLASERKESLPNWVPDLDLILDWNDRLIAANRNPGPLFHFLAMLTMEPPGDDTRAADFAVNVLKQHPRCWTAHDLLATEGDFGPARVSSEYTLRAFPAAAERGLGDLPGVPESVLKRFEKKTEEGDLTATGERLHRAVAALRKDSADGALSIALSAGELASLIDDFCITHALRWIAFCQFQWAVEIDDVVESLKPYYDGHRLEKLVEIQMLPAHEVNDAFKSLIETFRPCDYPSSADIDTNLWRQSHQDMSAMYPFETRITTYQSRLLSSGLREATILYDIGQARDLYSYVGIAPLLPKAVEFRLATTWDPGERSRAEQAAVERFPFSTGLIESIAERHRKANDLPGAERYYRLAAEMNSTTRSYGELINFYKETGQESLYLAAMLDSLERTRDAGLNHSWLHVAIANIYMKRQDFAAALPHARIASESYSAGGLLVLARCDSGLKKYDEADRLFAACAERYPNTSVQWYEWCQYTGEGSLSSAMQAMREYADSALESHDSSALIDSGIFLFTAGELDLAKQAVKKSLEYGKIRYRYVTLAAIHAEQGDTDARDQAIRDLILASEDPNFAEGSAIDVRWARPLGLTLQKMYATPTGKSIDFKKIDEMIREQADTGQTSRCEAYIGHALLTIGRTADGVRYLQRAARNPLANYGTSLSRGLLRRMAPKSVVTEIYYGPDEEN